MCPQSYAQLLPDKCQTVFLNIGKQTFPHSLTVAPGIKLLIAEMLESSY